MSALLRMRVRAPIMTLPRTTVPRPIIASSATVAPSRIRTWSER